MDTVSIRADYPASPVALASARNHETLADDKRNAVHDRVTSTLSVYDGILPGDGASRINHSS